MATITNHWRIPSFELNNLPTYIVGRGGATISQTNTAAYRGTWSAQITGSGFDATSTQAVPIAQGQVWSVAFWATGTGSVRVGLQERTSGGAFLAADLGTAVTLDGTWKRVVHTRTITSATAAQLLPYAEGGTNWRLDAMMIVAGSAIPDYFDGDSPGAVWTGTPHTSTSILTIPDAATVLRIGSSQVGPLRVGRN